MRGSPFSTALPRYLCQRNSSRIRRRGARLTQEVAWALQSDGLRDAVRRAGRRGLAIIGGLVIKGPTRKIMNELGTAAVRRALAA
ncbi:hypothetical protein [Rhodopseudomonas telluris]|uniref:Uncharacterized protein n=1 Tax=Rhodopseudomonas telluris TaxID=644215 RepID=A0ABV6ER27_9BRAD